MQLYYFEKKNTVFKSFEVAATTTAIVAGNCS